jgi:hypothetical protein
MVDNHEGKIDNPPSVSSVVDGAIVEETESVSAPADNTDAPANGAGEDALEGTNDDTPLDGIHEDDPLSTTKEDDSDDADKEDDALDDAKEGDALDGTKEEGGVTSTAKPTFLGMARTPDEPRGGGNDLVRETTVDGEVPPLVAMVQEGSPVLERRHSSIPNPSLSVAQDSSLRFSSMVLMHANDNHGELSDLEIDQDSVDENADDGHDKDIKNITKDKEEEEEDEEGLGQPGQDNWSLDESDASFDSTMAREAAIRDGFIAFLIGYVQGQVFQKFMGWVNIGWAWFMKKIGRAQDDDDEAGLDAEDLAQEAIEAADPGAMNIVSSGVGGPVPTPPAGGGGGFGGPAPPGAPPGAPGVPIGPPPGVAEMAAAASQSAASAGATGASAGAASAGSAAAGMASAVASAGVAGQVGAAVGVAAVTAAAVSSGLMPTNTTTPMVGPIPYEDNFVPPVCSMDSLLKEGYVELRIGGLPPTVLPDQKYILELLFR